MCANHEPLRTRPFAGRLYLNFDSIFEVNFEGQIEWTYQGADNTVRAIKYSYDFFQLNNIGDLNNDGFINILDVIILVNVILGVVESNDSFDFNNDNFVDILDIILLINIILT